MEHFSYIRVLLLKAGNFSPPKGGGVKKKNLVFLMAAGLLLSTGGRFLQASSNGITSVSLFKNGLGFVTSQALISEKTEKVLIEKLPVPVHGTFWIYPLDKGVTIKDAKAFEKEFIESIPAITVAEILEANVGQAVTIQLSPEKFLTGKILSVPGSRNHPLPAPQFRSSYLPASPENASLMVFQAEEGILFLNKNQVLQVIVSPLGGVRPLRGDFKTEIERKKKGVVLEVNTSGSAGRGRIGFQYLTKGITWAPGCTVDISDPKKALITARAEIINEIEDLEEVSVNFVTGFPNFQFSEVASPIAMQGDLAAFLNSLANPGGTLRSPVMTQVVMHNVAGAGTAFSGYASTPGEGQSAEELFFYEKKGITLEKGQRGYYPLYEMEVPYEHIYEWKIKDILDEQERYQRQDQMAKTEEVWHSIRLANTGKIPWTTSPALTIQLGQALGQDIIYYTSPGAKSNLKITQAVDIKAEQAEFEVNRQRNAARFYGNSYDLVDIKGVLNISNFKKREILLTVTKELSGEDVSATPDARIEKIAKGLKMVNTRCLLTWEVPVRASEKTMVEYSYKVYVRN